MGSRLCGMDITVPEFIQEKIAIYLNTFTFNDNTMSFYLDFEEPLRSHDEAINALKAESGLSVQKTKKLCEKIIFEKKTCFFLARKAMLILRFPHSFWFSGAGDAPISSIWPKIQAM